MCPPSPAHLKSNHILRLCDAITTFLSRPHRMFSATDGGERNLQKVEIINIWIDISG
jgi:hypothetical protein